MAFIVGKPSDLIEKIVCVQAFDPTNSTLVALLERETDLFGPYIGSVGVDSVQFREFTEKFGQLKTKLSDAHLAYKETRHTLYNLAMSSKTTAEQFREAIRDFRNADQTILSTKSEIDNLFN
jgi:hypothetical protein